MSRPGAPVHPQHGADSRGGRGRAHAALSTSFPRRGRPIASVHLMGASEELGVPQLRERHVRRTRTAKSLSKSEPRNSKRRQVGAIKKKEKIKKIPREEEEEDEGLSKSPEPLFFFLHQRQASPLAPSRSCITAAVWHLECGVMRVSGRGSFWMWS